MRERAVLHLAALAKALPQRHRRGRPPVWRPPAPCARWLQYPLCPVIASVVATTLRRRPPLHACKERPLSGHETSAHARGRAVKRGVVGELRASSGRATAATERGDFRRACRRGLPPRQLSVPWARDSRSPRSVPVCASRWCNFTSVIGARRPLGTSREHRSRSRTASGPQRCTAKTAMRLTPPTSLSAWNGARAGQGARGCGPRRAGRSPRRRARCRGRARGVPRDGVA